MASIGGSAGFGAISGSSLATVATISSVALPEMRKAGYNPGFAAGALAAGGTLGSLIVSLMFQHAPGRYVFYILLLPLALIGAILPVIRRRQAREVAA